MVDREECVAQDDAIEGLEPLVLAVCDAVGEFIEYWGFKAVHGRVWTLLALSAEPVAQVKIAETLNVSRSLISAVVSDLSQRGLVSPTSDRRNAPYVAITDFWPVVAGILRSREWVLIEEAKTALEALLAAGDGPGAAVDEGEYDMTRARALLTVTDAALNVLRLVIKYPPGTGSERWVKVLKRISGLARLIKG